MTKKNPKDLENQPLIPIHSPGQLMYDKDDHSWVAVDDTSPVGQIGLMRKEALEMLADNPSADAVKAKEAEFRSRLVEIYNNYASARFNGKREVVNGQDFRGVNLAYIASRPLLGFRSDLIRTAQQAQHPVLFDRWETDSKNIRTPTKADEFLTGLFRKLRNAEEQTDTPTDEALALSEVLMTDGAEGYIKLANIFYAGDMKKTYQNLSSVAQMSRLSLPDGWQQFHGSTAEFRTQSAWIERNPNATDVDFSAYFKLKSKKGGLNFAAINNMSKSLSPA